MTNESQKFIIAKALETLLLNEDPDAAAKIADPNGEVTLLGMLWSTEEATEALGKISNCIRTALETQADIIQAEFENVLGVAAPPKPIKTNVMQTMVNQMLKQRPANLN